MEVIFRSFQEDEYCSIRMTYQNYSSCTQTDELKVIQGGQTIYQGYLRDGGLCLVQNYFLPKK